MNKYTLLALLGSLAVTSCTTMKETTEAMQPIPLEVQVEDTTPVTADPISEISKLLDNQNIDISIREKTMSPEGNLVLTLNGNKYFGDGSTITIKADKLDDLKKAVYQINAIMSVSAQRSNKLKSIIIQEESRVPVTYE